MYPISNTVLALFQSGAMQYARLTIGSSTIANDRIKQGTFSINRYVETNESVAIGSCVAAEMVLVLDNYDGTYDNTDFVGSEAYVEIGVEDANHTIQYIPQGYFTFDEATRTKNTVSLAALDRMTKFDIVVNASQLSFPYTLTNLLDRICTLCGVTKGTFTLTNASYSVASLPSEAKTYRDLLRWICEVSGSNAYISYDGKLYLGWYGTTSQFNILPSNRTSSDLDKNTFSITGVTILTGDNQKYTAGTNTRPITITNNPFITTTQAQSVATTLNTKLGGFSYCPFTAVMLPSPMIFPMDRATFTTAEGTSVAVSVSEVTYKLNGSTAIACKGEMQVRGRSYGLADQTFYASNIAAGAVTADKISAGAVTADKINVQDLSALNATIGGWNINTNSLNKQTVASGTTYNAGLYAPNTATASSYAVQAQRTSSTETANVGIGYDGRFHANRVDTDAGRTEKLEIDGNEIYAEQTFHDYVDTDTDRKETTILNGSHLYLQDSKNGSGSYASYEAALWGSPTNATMRLDNYSAGGTDDTYVRATAETQNAEVEIWRNGKSIKITPKDIRYYGTKSEQPMIQFIDNTSDAHGNGIAIGGGGQTIIGGGESANAMKNEVGTSGSEVMYVGNDEDVLILTNLQNGWSYRKVFTFGASGNLTLPGKVTSGGLYTSGRVYGSGDDEGIVVGYASNNYASINLGGNSGRHTSLYLSEGTTGTSKPIWKFTDKDGNSHFLSHPAKTGVVMTEGDVLYRGEWWASDDTSKNANDLRGKIVFAYWGTHNTPTTGNLVAFDNGSNTNYTFQLQGGYATNKLYFRNRNGDNATWGAWKEVASTGDLSSYVAKSGDTMTGTLNLTNSNISIESVSSEKYVRLVSSSGILLYLDMAASGHGLWSSGYGTSLTDGTTYTPSGSWIIFRDPTGYVRIPKWASTGANGTPVYFDSNGTPAACVGLLAEGRVYGSGDDEGVVVKYASNGYAGVILGGNTGRRSQFYLTGGASGTDAPYWGYNDGGSGSVTYKISHPKKTGTIALTSDLKNGTVTSVAVTGSKGISVSGSPITSSGTIDVSVSTSSGTATRNTTNTSAGEVKYQKYGRVVTIYTTAQITITSTGAALSKVYFTGLPKPPAMVTFTATGAGNKAVALQITTDGYIQGVYNAPPSGVLTIGTTYIASS